MSSSKPGDEVARALAAVVRYTRPGVRSIQEVLMYLRRRGCSPETAARVIAQGRARGILDDRACARLCAEHWARAGYAWSAIRLKLSAKGLDEPTIEETATYVDAAFGDEARARLVVTSSLRRHMRQPARLARTLASRGFDPDLIERVLRESFGPIPSDAER